LTAKSATESLPARPSHRSQARQHHQQTSTSAGPFPSPAMDSLFYIQPGSRHRHHKASLSDPAQCHACYNHNQPRFSSVFPRTKQCTPATIPSHPGTIATPHQSTGTGSLHFARTSDTPHRCPPIKHGVVERMGAGCAWMAVIYKAIHPNTGLDAKYKELLKSSKGSLGITIPSGNAKGV
jgi:hypothetical protein